MKNQKRKLIAMKYLILFELLTTVPIFGLAQSEITPGKNVSAFLQSYVAEDAFLLDSMYQYNYNSPSDSVLFIREYYGYDQWGNQNNKIRYSSCVDCSSPGTGKTEFVFDENGNCIVGLYYDWDEVTQNWRPTRKLDQTFINNELVSQIDYVFSNSSGQWVKRLKHEYLYGENFQLFTDICYFWDENQSSWSYYTKFERQLDSSGNSLSVTYYIYDPTKNEWVGSNKEETIYINGDRTMFLKSEWDIESKQWINSRKEEYNYNEENKDTLIIGAVWNSSEGNWLNTYKSEHEYDGNGNVLSSTTYLYNSDDQWIGDVRDEYRYDEWSNKTAHVVYNWDVTSKHWVEKYKTVYTYDQSKVIDEIVSSWIISQNDWVLTVRLSSVFDSNGNQVLYSNYIWNTENETWTINYKSQYYYSLHHFTNKTEVSNSPNPIIYPNPATDFINITNPTDKIEKCLLQLFDFKGRLVLSKETELKDSYRLSLQGFSNGAYLLNLRIGNNQHTVQIIKANSR